MPTYSSFVFSDKEKNDIRKLHESYRMSYGRLLKEDNSSEFNTLSTQVREVGLRAADLKTLKKEAKEKLTGEEKTKLISLINSKLAETGI
jgi:hypothetical protein